MLRYVYKLHHSDVRYTKLKGCFIYVQALGHDYALWGEILEHQVVMMQIGQLAKHLKRDLCYLLSRERLAQVS